MEHIVEFWYDGECLEQRKYKDPPWGIPVSGDEIHMEFENPHYAEEHGRRWTVVGRRIIMFQGDRVRTVQLDCEPVTKGKAFAFR